MLITEDAAYAYKIKPQIKVFDGIIGIQNLKKLMNIPDNWIIISSCLKGEHPSLQRFLDSTSEE